MGCGASDEQDKKVQDELDADARIASRDHKLLLLGAGSSGKSTFFKQLCQIHGNGFQKQDIERATQNIYDCIIDQMKQLVEQCQENIKNNDNNRIDDNNDNLSPNNNDNYKYELKDDIKEAAEYLLSSRIPRGGIDITPEIAKIITLLWNDQSIKKTFHTRTNLGVVDSAPHFFEDIDRIGAIDYVPTSNDILLVRIPTTGIRSASFMVDNNKFTLVDVGGQRNERKKWIDQFSVVDAVLFVVSLSCYDQNLFEEEDINAMHESIRLFNLVVNNRYFKRTSMIVFFNKLDLFQKKIQIKPIKKCFPDYDGDDGDYETALKYITEIFVSCNQDINKQIYTHPTTATNPGNVKKVFHDVQHAVVVQALGRNGIL